MIKNSLDYYIDLQFGLDSEKKTKPLIEQFLNTNLNIYDNRFSTFDFYNDLYLIELKTRRCKHNTYADLMMNINKYNTGINEIKNNKKHIYYFFKFEDGLYYYKQNIKHKHNKRFAKNRQGNQTEYIYIKTKLLKNTELKQ
tara:strand:- start:139 stop:561 length:423 start_codon:yes stop_codon:yes gene_type:complete